MGALIGTQVAISLAASGDTTVIQGISGRAITIRKLVLFANAANNVALWDGPSATGNVIIPAMDLPLQGGFAFDGDEEGMNLSPGNGFVINCSGAGAVVGWVKYDLAYAVGATRGGES